MAEIGDYARNRLIDFLFRGQALSPPATMYAALFTTAPNHAIVSGHFEQRVDHFPSAIGHMGDRYRVGAVRCIHRRKYVVFRGVGGEQDCQRRRCRAFLRDWCI
jgi:hypothetical protein